MDRIGIVVSTTGGAGVASGSAQSNLVDGLVEAVHVSFASNIPNTLDLVLYGQHSDVILSLSNQQASQSAMYYPRRTQHSSAGSELGYNATQTVPTRHMVHGPLTLSVAQSDALAEAVRLTVYLTK